MVQRAHESGVRLEVCVQRAAGARAADRSPYRARCRGGLPSVQNGICMSALHHVAFDSHLIGVDPDYCVHVASPLQKQRRRPAREHQGNRRSETRASAGSGRLAGSTVPGAPIQAVFGRDWDSRGATGLKRRPTAIVRTVANHRPAFVPAPDRSPPARIVLDHPGPAAEGVAELLVGPPGPSASAFSRICARRTFALLPLRLRTPRHTRQTRARKSGPGTGGDV